MNRSKKIEKGSKVLKKLKKRMKKIKQVEEKKTMALYVFVVCCWFKWKLSKTLKNENVKNNQNQKFEKKWKHVALFVTL